MPDHNFENKVKQKMEELNFQPSEQVWANVQTGITSRRKRRAFLYIPAAVILSCLVGFYLWHRNLPEKTTDNNQITHIADTDKPSQNPSLLRNGEEKTRNIDEINRENNKLAAAGGEVENKQIMPGLTSNSVNSNLKINKTEKVHSLIENNPEANLYSLKDNFNPEKNSVTQNSLKDDDHNPEKLPEYVKLSLPVFQLSKFNGPAAVISISEIDFPLEEQNSLVRVSENNKIKWGLSVSGSNTGIFSGSIVKMKMESLDNASLLNSGSPASFAPVIYKPDPMQSNIDFSAGVFAEKDVSQRLSITAGLKLSRYSTTFHVGIPMLRDTIVTNYSGNARPINAFYSPERKEKYTNRFNLIELPLNLKWRAINSEHFPLYLSGGFSIGHLFKTNALHFDSFNGVYYQDANQFNKWHGFFNAGISTEIFRNSATPVSIGPTASYMFSKLIPENMNEPKRLFSFGVEANIYLKGKQSTGNSK